jgi:hypothetical protein
MSSSKTATKKTNGAAATKRKPVKAPASHAKTATAKATKAATTTDASVAADMSATAAAMEKALAAGDLASLSAESLQKLMAAAVKAYSAKREAGESFLPLNAAGRVTPTDIMLTSSQLLRAGTLQVFELGRWQSWTGN